MMRNPEQTIGNMIDKNATAFVSYTDKEGFPVTKAMFSPREREGISVLWFTTNVSSDKVAAFKTDPRGSVYFMDKRFFRGVCLSGTFEVILSDDAKERIWREGDEKYYPQGIHDEDYCVLKFTARKGRYYSNFKSENFEI